jgi:hypothetical protein
VTGGDVTEVCGGAETGGVVTDVGGVVTVTGGVVAELGADGTEVEPGGFGGFGGTPLGTPAGGALGTGSGFFSASSAVRSLSRGSIVNLSTR